MNKISVFIKVLRTIKNFPTYFLDYLKLSKNSYSIYKLRDSLKFKLRTNSTDRQIFNEVWIYNEYNNFKIKPSDVIVDVGAHIGFFSIFASNQAKKGKVFSFEPSKSNFNLLKENINLNRIKNIFAINKALASKTGKTSFFLDENSSLNSLYLSNKKSKKVIVDTASLLDFFRKYKLKKINLLKMDCEGGEYDILFNSPKNLFKKVEKIVLEYHNLDSKRNNLSLTKFFKQNNFKILSYNKLTPTTGLIAAVNKNS